MQAILGERDRVPAPDAVDRIIEQWQKERPDLDTAAMEILGRIYRIARRAGDRMEEVYGTCGLSRADFDVLSTLRRDGEPFRLSPSDLAATTMVTTGGMTSRLDRLENRGLVRRLPDSRDRRSLLVELTGRARDLVDRGLVDGLADQQRQLAGLDAGELGHLAAMLRVVLGNLEGSSGPEAKMKSGAV